MPGLDGFRGLAVVAVLLFHGGFGWARGGFLGVTSFFVLSGFLITSLLLLERARTGRVELGAFWSRRARRLVPAALLTIALVIAYVAVVNPQAAGRVAGDGMASALWVANWRLIFTGQTYADLFSDPSPFQHMWSLAIEEQFYLLLPLGVAFVLSGRRRVRLFAAVVGACVLASTAAAWVIGPSARAYYGTDARVAEPLVGVLLAVALVGPGGLRQFGRRAARVVDGLAVAALGGLAYLMVSVDDRSPFLYQGGLLAAAALSAAVVLAASQPNGLVRRVLAAPPLVAVGRISYGVYLFHWPVFLWMTPGRTGLPPVSLFLARCAVTLGLASLSYVVVERPVRLGRLPRLVGPVAWANTSVGLLAGLVLVAGLSPVSPHASFMASGAASDEPPPPPPVVADSAPSTASSAEGAATAAAPAPSQATKTGGPRSRSAKTPTTSSGGRSRGPGTILGTTTGSQPPPPPPPPARRADGQPPKPTRLKVAVVGDSMARDLADGLAAWGRDRGDVAVYNLALGGCPISRGGTRWVDKPGDFAVIPMCGWWANEQSSRWRALADFKPDVVVMQDGMNAIWTRYRREWGEYRSLGDVRFDQWIVSEYQEAARRFQSIGATTLFLNAVCVDWRNLEGPFDKYRDGYGEWMVNHINQITGALSWMWTADLFSHLCPNGQFSNTIDGVENARPDRYHLSPAAAKAVAVNWLGPLLLQSMPSGAEEQQGQH